jgi:quercetin dioxygenase-like cupin family protein
MPARNPLLQEFLTSVAAVFSTIAVGPETTGAIDRIHDALQASARAGSDTAKRLEVCQHLDGALATARTASPALARVADAFAALEPLLHWTRRSASGPFASDNWPEGHANATIVGPGGLEQREDLVIGVSLLAPQVRYPDHNHSPEEVYLVLSPGRFQHGKSEWFEPGIGGTLYNEPNIKHAMASGEAPLLALWYLWVGEPASILPASR